jgi:hypothetical protein
MLPNMSIPGGLQTCIPQNACSFYHGYYTMSTDMGILILKLGLLFALLEVFHILIKNFFEHYVIPKFKQTFSKPKDLKSSDDLKKQGVLQ